MKALLNWELDPSSYSLKKEINNCFIIYLKHSKDFNRFRKCVLILQNNNNLFSSVNKISYVLFLKDTSNRPFS